MSKHQQSSLDQFFKITSSPSPTMNIKNNIKKRRKLSLVRTSTPKKAPKINSSSMNIKAGPEVIELSSGDENGPPIENNYNGNLSQNSIHSEASSSSQSTVLYHTTPSTPKKSPAPLSYNSLQSPKTRAKFYSPEKQHAVFQRPHVRKKSLAFEQNGNRSHTSSVEDEDFNKACEGMDDMSIFLLSVINKYLKDDNLNKLLDPKSAELLKSCLYVIKPGVRVVYRLYWNQHIWYRRHKLVKFFKHKDESFSDPQFEVMLKCLVENGLVIDSAVATNTMTFDDFSKVLNSQEVKLISKNLHQKSKSKKEATEALRSFMTSQGQPSISKFFGGTPDTSDNSKRVLEMMKAQSGTCYKLSDLATSALYRLYTLMYLGINYEIIRQKQLPLTLINVKVERELYPVDKEMAVDNASVVFGSSDEFDRYINAQLIYDDYLTEVDKKTQRCIDTTVRIILNVYKLYNEINDEDMLRYKTLPTWLNRYTPAYIYIKILETGIEDLKKTKSESSYQHALDILTTLISQNTFRQHKKADWYAEKALILHNHLKRHDEAAQVLLEGFESDLSEEAKDAMRPRANKIAHQQNITLAAGLSEALQLASKDVVLEKDFPSENVFKQHVEKYNEKGKKKFEIRKDGERKLVEAEDYCIYHYTSNGIFTDGKHWEGRIATTIYFLLFWDIIYTKPRGVVGVFLSHYQRYPLDMYHDSFYANRKTLIDDRLTEIENMETNALIEMMRLKWEERPECEVSEINRTIGWDNVRAVAACFGARALAAVCRRLAAAGGRARAGFPDLTLWDTRTMKIKFVEVKTDTDTPSLKQLQWMQYLREHGIDTGFCYVGVAPRGGRRQKAPARGGRRPAVGGGRRPAVGGGRQSAGIAVRSVADINNGGATRSSNIEEGL